MHKVCPHINTKEWKVMVQHLGSEREAYRAYMAHNFTIPRAIPKAQLKKELGLTSTTYSKAQLIGIWRKVKKYNKTYGTSHFVQPRQIGESETYGATIIFNYLPVNKEEQLDRERRRAMQGYIGMEDGESFENVSPPPYTPSESEQEAGQFNEEGDFLPPAQFFPDTRDAISPKFKPLMDARQEDLRDLYKNKNDLVRKRKFSKNPDQKASLSKKIITVERNIEEKKNQITKIKNLNQLAKIEEFAEEDMALLDYIFSKDKPSFSDLNVARRKIKLWQEAGDFSGNQPHIFYDQDEMISAEVGLKDITDKFIEWKRRADSYNNKLIEIEENVTGRKVRATLGKDVHLDFDETMRDIGFMVSKFLDISETNNKVLQSLHTWVKTANTNAKLELDAIFEEFDELISKTGLSDFNLFRQRMSNTDSRKTGEMVFRWTQSYFDWLSATNFDRRRKISSANPNNPFPTIREANNEYIEELRKHTTVFDPRILFFDNELFEGKQPTQSQIDSHIKELKDILGERGYEELYKENKRKLEEYKLERESTRSLIASELGAENKALIEQQMDIWEAEHSPYLFASLMRDDKFKSIQYKTRRPNPSNRYTTLVPTNAEFHDNNFKLIEANDNYRNLYNYMFDLLQTMKLYLPNERISFMSINSIPYLRKNASEIMNNHEGIGAAFNKLREDVTRSLRTEGISGVDQKGDKKEFQLQMLQNKQKELSDYVDLKTIEFMRDNDGKQPPYSLKQEWRRQRMDELAEEKSFDLGRIIKAFASMSIVYKHRSAIEDQVRVAQEIIRRGVEKKRDSSGQVTDKNTNLGEMLDNFLDVVFWGYASNKPQGVSDIKKLTAEEKVAQKTLLARKEELKQLLEDGKITEDSYNKRLDFLNDQLQQLGGYKTWSKYGDALLKYIQLKGMGWNVFAGFANLGFGFISNVIEASDGRNYSVKSFWKAQALVLNSVARNITFNSWDGLNGNGKKIRVLMNMLDVLKESKNETFKPTTGKLFKKVGDKLEWANPYNPQSRSEYLNQAPIMIAMLMDTKITIDGKEMSMWDAFDQEGKLPDGTVLNLHKIDKALSDEKITKEEHARQRGLYNDFIKLKIRIDKVVKMNHGNYDPDSHIAIKRIWFGRAVSQFRTWAFQGFAERFKGEFEDRQLKNIKTGDSYVIRKGRYLSYASYFRGENKLGAMGQTFNLTFKLLAKLIGFSPNFDSMINDKFTETDAANMRKNLTEIVIYMFITAFTLGLKAAVGSGDDDEDKKKILAFNFAINQMARLSTDIMFYTNPIEFDRLFRNAIPAFSLVVDSFNAMDSAWTLISGGEDILQSGPSKGKSRTWRDVQKLIPGPVQYQKLKSATQTIYKR